MDKNIKNIGISAKAPKEKCEDKNCPFHGNLKPRGRIFTGVVLAKDTHRTATVEWTYSVLVPKYERSETRRTKIHVHNPSCIDANVGDIVRLAETRPLSKTKNFVVIENLGKKKGFIEELAAREEAEVKEKPKEEVKEVPEEEAKPEESTEEGPKVKEFAPTEEKKEETPVEKETGTQTTKESDASLKGAKE